METLRTIAISTPLFRKLQAFARENHAAVERILEPTIIAGLDVQTGAGASKRFDHSAPADSSSKSKT